MIVFYNEITSTRNTSDSEQNLALNMMLLIILLIKGLTKFSWENIASLWNLLKVIILQCSYLSLPGGNWTLVFIKRMTPNLIMIQNSLTIDSGYGLQNRWKLSWNKLLYEPKS